MALSDLAVFSDSLRTTAIEMLAENIDLFNAASQGTIVLGTEAHPGDYFDSLKYKLLSNVVRQRNPYGTGTPTVKKLTNITETIVKIAAGSYPVELDPAQFAWIQSNPQAAADDVGVSIAEQMLQQMLTNCIAAVSGAMANVGAAVTLDLTSATFATPGKLDFIGLANGAQKFGDQSGRILAWVMSSVPATGILVNALTNAQRLFTFGTVNVMRDALGRVFVITDNAALKLATGNGTTTNDVWATLGLTSAAVTVMQQADFISNIDTRNGGENISRTMQSEWSYMMGVKGFAWDKANGGHAPTASALATGTNWDQYVTSPRDTAGVLIKSNG